MKYRPLDHCSTYSIGRLSAALIAPWWPWRARQARDLLGVALRARGAHSYITRFRVLRGLSGAPGAVGTDVDQS